MKFQLDHISSLFKYTGISFTAGAVTHGFFSEERSFWTALLGVVLYIIGSIIAKIANPDKSHTWTSVLFVGIFASIGLGFFTGGLQHFPDSPDRSLWVVPVGFLMSLIAVYLMEETKEIRKQSVFFYAAIGGVLVIAASGFAHHYFDTHKAQIYNHHGHDSHKEEAAQSLEDNHSDEDIHDDHDEMHGHNH